jgi:beta-glucosidase
MTYDKSAPSSAEDDTASFAFSPVRRGFEAARRSAAPLVLSLALAGGPMALAAQASEEKPAYLDASLPISLRVDDLMKRMTLKEKIGQMNLPSVPGNTPAELVENARKLAAGTYTNEIGPTAGFFSIANVLGQKDLAWQVNYFNELQKIATAQTRLKIPLLQDEEGTHGVLLPNATVFPEGLAIGSTFDMPIVARIYAATAQEARSVGIHALSTLVMELDRDPRMGRNMEAYTEDPYLYAQIASNIVRGAQGTDINAPDKAVALLTDFPTQSQPASGLERGAVEVSERSLRENFLVPWVSAINAGALGAMAGYPEIDDIPEHSSEKWNTDVLRHELGFKGILVSEGDGFASMVYERVAPDQKQAGQMALRAGVDVGITHEPAYLGPLVEGVQAGEVPEWLIDRAVRRVLELKFELGLFEHPFVDLDRAKQILHSQEHQDLALQVAREGIVLLKNQGDMLPLKKQLKSIAVIGPDADDSWSQLGDYSPQGVPFKVTTVLDGIKQKVGPETQVVYAHGCDVIGGKKDFTEAVAAARKAEVAVVVVGERPDNLGERKIGPTDGEGYDVASLDLTGNQEDLVQTIQATGTPVVLVLVNGRPLSVRWEAEHIPAIVEAWEPGERGGEAVADVLFGDYNPTGRLAITIPRSSGQLPAFYNYKPSKNYWVKQGWSKLGGYVDMPGTPLYPFGYGLSYTSFKYSDLRIEPGKIAQSGPVNVSVDVENTGSRTGTQVVQMYVGEHYAPVSLPVEQLRGFERVELQPAEKKTVKMTLRPQDLMLLDRDMQWRVSPGTFDVMIGNSSADIALTGSFEVTVPSGVLAGRGFSTQPDLAR